MCSEKETNSKQIEITRENRVRPEMMEAYVRLNEHREASEKLYRLPTATLDPLISELGRTGDYTPPFRLPASRTAVVDETYLHVKFIKWCNNGVIFDRSIIAQKFPNRNRKTQTDAYFPFPYNSKAPPSRASFTSKQSEGVSQQWHTKNDTDTDLFLNGRTSSRTF